MMSAVDMESRHLLGSLVAGASIAGTTLVALAFRVNAVTAGFAYLLTLLAVAVRYGFLPGCAGSIAAALCFNYFFFAPIGTFRISDPHNWVSLGSFLLATLIASRLVVRERARAEAAEASRVEALRTSDSLKTGLLRAVSHDLTTPLTSILLSLESLRREVPENSESAKTVDVMSEEAGRLGRRISNLLAVARLETGRYSLRREPTPAADLFRAARGHLGLIAGTRTIEAHVSPDCPDLDVDPSLVVEMLINLIENAHRASPASGPIELVAATHPTDPSRVRLEVLDRGNGLPEPEAPAAAGRDSGSPPPGGLGLEIVRRFAGAHGGGTDLLPRAGGGTRAILDLPAARLAGDGTAVNP